MPGRTHYLDPAKVHFKWDNSLEPVIYVEPGEVVEIEAQEVSNGQIAPRSSAEDLSKLDFDTIYPLAGPIHIRGAEKGDVLEVEILDLRPKEWGWTGFLPDLGLLPEDFPYAYIKHWDLSNRSYTELKPGIRIPIEPFCGVMGVAPEEAGAFHPLPPGNFGGNMDIRHLTKGNTLLLPVFNRGALFSCGDCHSAQGDGEVCVTGIESPMWVKLRFGLRKGVSIPEPQFICRGPLTARSDVKGYHATTGIAPDLMEASKKAVRSMISHLTRSYGLNREEAYVLCSVAVDLKISELVDRPNWVVSAYLPLSIFG